MFNDEAEFRREFDEYPAAAGYLLPYSPDTEFFDRFLAANYHRIPEDAWARGFGVRGLSRTQAPGVWRILNSAYLLGIDRSYYATGEPAAGMFEWNGESDDYTDDTPSPITGVLVHQSQAEIDDAFHQRQMDYIATFPVEPLDPINRYNSQTPEYVTAYDLGITPSPLGEPPEYLPPLPVYTTPEYSPSNQPCRLNMCVNDAMPGSEFCSSCHGAKGRRRITRRSTRKPHCLRRKPRRSRKPHRSRKPRSRRRRKGKSHKKKTRSKK